MKASTAKKSRPMYTDDYYRMEKLIKDPKFKARLKKLLDAYADMGCPVPANGFKNWDLYKKWLDKFFSKHEKMMRARIDDHLLPPVPGSWRDDILKEFGFDMKDDKYAKFLDSFVYFGKKNLEEYSFEIRWIRNQDTDTMELFIRVYPYTRRDHVSKYWNKMVAPEQKHLKQYIGKNKPWEQFDRDLDIYQISQMIESERQGKKPTKDERSVDQEVYARLNGKYPRLTLSDIRKAISRVEKLEP